MGVLWQPEETSVVLRYPLGQDVEALIPGSLRVGDVFTLYGCEWEVVCEVPPPLTQLNRSPRLLCTKTAAC